METENSQGTLVRTVAVLPVKRFGDAKSRLGEGGLDAHARRVLARAMLRDTLAQIAASELIDDLVIVSAELELIDLAPGIRVIGHDAEVSHSAAAAAGVRDAIARGATTVLLVPGDCPLVRAEELDALVARARDDGIAVCVVPDHTGTGTNALVLTPPDAIAPSFGPGSHARHLQLAREAGLAAASCDVRGLSLDVDTGDDCAELADRLAAPGHSALITENAIAEIMIDRHRLPGGLAR